MFLAFRCCPRTPSLVCRRNQRSETRCDQEECIGPLKRIARARWIDVALFLPCDGTKERQTAARRDTKRRSNIPQFCEGSRTIRQHPAHSRKSGLTILFRLLTGELLVRVQPE